MPPKKKEQQIDLNSLPECKSINVNLLSLGKKTRANAILERLQKQAEKFMFRVRKSEVLDHAKEKNIYIDPNTLTDKQKKDPKFMESINTELTPAVIAKAVQSLLGALTVKARIEKKNNPQFFANQARRYDIIYVLEDFPEMKEQFQELAKIGEGVKYVLVVEPKINWANAPELPEDNENDNQEEEDEQIKQYKTLLKKEQKTQEDIEFQNRAKAKITSLRKMRSQSSYNSPFRNCTISVLEPEIDPYHEENSLNELTKAFFDNINKLDADFVEYDEWKKGKQTDPMPQPQIPSDTKKHQIKGTSLISMLDGLARGLDSSLVRPASHKEDENVVELIEKFTAGKKSKPKLKEAVISNDALNFIGANEEIGDDSQLTSDLRSQLRYPGINRFQIPEISPKSQGIRKLELANYSLFLKGSMSIDQFLRRQRISNFQEFIRQFDEQRTYSFADRVFQQQHNVDSLRRELYRASEAGQASTFSKYDENTDKLYMMFVYRNNSRRVGKRVWQSSWKVLPNYEYWLKYFKNNDGNLSNNQFYDLDYEKIGNIEEVSRVFTLKNGTDGAAIVDKQCSAGNTTQKLLYSIKQQLIFGLHHHQFYSQLQNIKIFHHPKSAPQEPAQQEFETVILLPEGIVRISSLGHLLLQYDGQQRMVTPEGYTIIYEKDRSVILHPNGGISYSKETYVNERGFGLKEGHLHTSLILQRTAANGKVLKREDDTVIVHKGGENPSKWVKFYEGTEYQVVGEEVNIQKSGRPFVCCQGGEMKVITKELQLKVVPRGDCYESSIYLSNGAVLTMNLSEVKVSQKEDKQVIVVRVDRDQILSSFGEGQQIRVGIDFATYKQKDKVVDAREDQQRYGDDETLPSDYIEPRLFIINSDNTGVQLLNEKMVDGYLKEFKGRIQQTYKLKVDDKEEIHIISKVDQIQHKFINNDLIIQLDVFDNSKEQPKTPRSDNLAIRTLIKYPSLTPNDMAEVLKIKAEVDNWKKANLREENEFGHKPKNTQYLKSKIDSKLLTLKMRQRNDPPIDSQALKTKGKASYLATVREDTRQQQAKKKEAELRKRYLTKRDSVIRDYKPINLSGRRKELREEQVQQVGPFLDHYFLTTEGKKALSEMPEWVFRPKDVKEPVQLDAQIQNQLNNTRNLNREDENSEEARERYDTVEVNLNPRPEKQIIIKPSVFTQREIDEERVAFESQKKAYKYHEIKRKDFNVYGEERRSRPEVRGLLRTQAISEINQKYLVTQAPLDKRIKISSMRNKLTSSASNIVEMRKEGPHSLLMKTLDKGNDVNKLLEKRTMMVQADLNDKLQRDILINPVEANFGVILERKTYELKIDIKNQDIIPQRITLKRPKSIYAKATLNQMGPIAMGMTRKITVTFKASPEMLGRFTDEFDIVTKHEIYHIPIIAHIISENQLKNETLGLSAGVIEVEQGLRKKGEGSIELPRLK